MRPDEFEAPIRLGDAPPLLPFRKPFDLNAWQLPLTVLTVGMTLSLDSFVQLSETPFREDGPLSPMLLARFAVCAIGLTLVFVRPGDRHLLGWLGAMLGHFGRSVMAVYDDASDDPRGPTYFATDAEAMTHIKLAGEAAVFVVEPPMWGILKRTPLAASWWAKHVPYRLLLPIEPQGSLELMTDVERGARWLSFAAGLKALLYPVEFVGQARDEDTEWLVKCAAPPVESPFFRVLGPEIERWARDRAFSLQQRRIVAVAAAVDQASLVEHARDVKVMLDEAGLVVRDITLTEQREIFDYVHGARRFYPHPVDSFGIDGTNWVTLVVNRFPRHCVVGWLMFVIGQLRVDWALYCEPDDAKWVTRGMEWFQGMCDLPTADTAHHDAMRDHAIVEGKLKRNASAVHRATLVLTMPQALVPRVSSRLRKAGAEFREARYEHQLGRRATQPIGGQPVVGVTRPLDVEGIAGCYPFGSGGLRMGGSLLGTSRDGLEAVTLDLQHDVLNAAMVVILGVPGAGKTFLMQQLILRSGLPFVLIDMKPHLDERRHGDFYRFTMAAEGNYHVCRLGVPLPVPHPFAQTYNLAMLSRAEQVVALQKIAEQEWTRAVDSLEDRIFGIDEGNLLGQTEPGREFVERVVSQGRSVGLIGIVASQEVTDFLGNQRMAKAVTMSSVQFVLTQEFSNVDTVADKLKLGGEATAELRKFQVAPPSNDVVPVVKEERTRPAIMRVGQRMCSFRIEACPEEIALYTTKPADKRAMRLAA